MIDPRRLRVLRAVAHYGMVTAAAQAMHFTPSAASQQIRQLERELDVVLLERHSRRQGEEGEHLFSQQRRTPENVS